MRISPEYVQARTMIKHKTVQDLVRESFDMDMKFVILPISLWFNMEYVSTLI